MLQAHSRPEYDHAPHDLEEDEESAAAGGSGGGSGTAADIHQQVQVDLQTARDAAALAVLRRDDDVSDIDEADDPKDVAAKEVLSSAENSDAEYESEREANTPFSPRAVPASGTTNHCCEDQSL